MLRGKYKEEAQKLDKKIIAAFGENIFRLKSSSVRKSYASILGSMCAISPSSRVTFYKTSFYFQIKFKY